MSVQSQFLKFDKKIRLNYESNSELAEKRDILVNILRNGDLPSFSIINQGSYGMYLGVEPIDKEYDIDVGLRFAVNKSDYLPMDLKNKIFDLLKDHTDYGADIKKPCVTVTYKKDGEKAYHVDLVSYCYENKDSNDSQMYLARGKSSDSESIRWEKADPDGLVKYINDKIQIDEAREQGRRVIRYIKRWKNNKFSNNGNAEPASIGITLLVLNNFQYHEENDLESLFNSIREIKNEFSYCGISEQGRDLYKIEYFLPLELNFDIRVNLFEKMSKIQMTDFKDKIEKLYDDLDDVINEYDDLEKYKKIRIIFGDDFEIPNMGNIAKKQTNYVPNSSASGKDY